MMAKKYLRENVLDAAHRRLDMLFSHLDQACVSFSGGKDSTVLLHLAIDAARRHNKLPVHVLFVDLEGQYKATIEHVAEMLSLPEVEPHWVCLPLNLRNAVSVFEPHWCCWEPGKEEHWVRDLPTHPGVVNNQEAFPFYRYRMEFEEFVPKFIEHLSGGHPIASLVGIRSDESLNRYRTIVKDRKTRWQEQPWTRAEGNAVSAYPIYDWRTEDIWTYIGQNNLAYNTLYDGMHLAGKSIHEMRICQPYGDDQRRGLDMFHKIEPDTWFRIVQRVSGANFGNIYCGQKILGYNRGLGLPPGHTWESYTKLLLKTMPEKSREHYLQKFGVFIKWWEDHGYPAIPDAGDRKEEAARKVPSWRRMCMCILKNDFWCKSLSFGMTKNLYVKYYENIQAGRAADRVTLLKERFKQL